MSHGLRREVDSHGLSGLKPPMKKCGLKIEVDFSMPLNFKKCVKYFKMCNFILT